MLVDRPDHVADVDETGDTLVANARLKAQALSRATGMPAVADDSGLEVDALDGVPGVHSARYAGENATYADNVNKLLAAMEGRQVRTARFRTIAMVCAPDGDEVMAEGVVEGVITREARGTGGFGYDPVFEPIEAGGFTLAELAPDVKNSISARGRAFRALRELLAD